MTRATKELTRVIGIFLSNTRASSRSYLLLQVQETKAWAPHLLEGLKFMPRYRVYYTKAMHLNPFETPRVFVPSDYVEMGEVAGWRELPSA